MSGLIDTEAQSTKLRARAIRVESRELLVADFTNTEQAKDLKKAPNCDGLGRIRHFLRGDGSAWPLNPLPIDPASAFLGRSPAQELQAQAFQNAACPWRCWYCFVPFSLLSASEKDARWVTAERLVELYLAIPAEQRPPMIDLTGGQPELVPEWIPWTMRALRARGAEGQVYLWSDDNLSNDYYWSVLSDEDRNLVSTFRGYGRVGCFKGWDEKSFTFNTRARPEQFERQFELFGRLLRSGLDMYAYATFTAEDGTGLRKAMASFVDRLQAVHENLPLRLVPLEIFTFGVVRERLANKLKTLQGTAARAIEIQREAVAAWTEEVSSRFSPQLRARRIQDVPMKLP